MPHGYLNTAHARRSLIELAIETSESKHFCIASNQSLWRKGGVLIAKKKPECHRATRVASGELLEALLTMFSIKRREDLACYGGPTGEAFRRAGSFRYCATWDDGFWRDCRRIPQMLVFCCAAADGSDGMKSEGSVAFHLHR